MEQQTPKKVKSNILLSLVDKRLRAAIALFTILLGFAFFGALLFLNIPDPKREIIVFILGNVTSYISLILAYFFGSSEEKDKDKHLPLISDTNQVI